MGEKYSVSQTVFERRMFAYFAGLHEKYAFTIYSIVIYADDCPQRLLNCDAKCDRNYTIEKIMGYFLISRFATALK